MKKMLTYSANHLRDINDKINELGLEKEDIITIFPNIDGTYSVIYFAEE